MKFAPLSCHNPLLTASKGEVGLNLWEFVRSSLPAWIWLHAPIQVWKLPPRNIRAWKPLETRGNQASCSQQCNQCILRAGPTSNQVRVGRDWRWDKMGLRIRIPRAPYSMSAWYSLEGKVLAKQTNVEISCLLLQVKMINKQHKMIQFEICINPFCQFVIWLHADGLKIRIWHLKGKLLLN